MSGAEEHKAHAAAPFPARVGSYELLLPIASGGMGSVYLARKRGAGGFEREVALKLTHGFLRDEPEWTAQLIEEAKLAGRIHHPNVVQVLDVEDDPNGVFLVMEYVEGDTLGGLLRHARGLGERVPVSIALRILVDGLAGLHAAHELRDTDGQPLGLVHRDFTPQNILVGINGVSRLTDFGVAKAASRMSGTRTGVVKGKAAYMAPEQVRAQPLDRRADIWSAGIVAWEAFAGRRMRAASDDQVALLLQVATETPPRLRSVASEVPAAVDEAVASALTTDRTRRCPTAQRFAEALVQAWSGVCAPATHAAVAEYVIGASGRAIADRRQRASCVAQERAHERDVSIVTSSRTLVVRRSRAMPIALGALGVAVVCGVVLVRSGVLRAGHAQSGPGPVGTTAMLASPAPPASPHALHVAANAPLSELRIDGSVIALATPTSELTVEVPPATLRPGVVVMATSADGRTTSTALGNDVATVSLSFGPPDETPAASPPAPAASASASRMATRGPPRAAPAVRSTATTTATVAAPPTTGRDVPLAQSPYEKP
jgi:serine/threonine protein kinase